MIRAAVLALVFSGSAGSVLAQSAADLHAGHAAPGDVRPDGPHAARVAGPRGVEDGLMADEAYDPQAMRRARSILRREHGGARFSKVQVDMLEWVPEGNGYGWQVEGAYGGDLNRLAFRTEAEGRTSDGLEALEVQLLYSRAVARYVNAQAGIRYDIEPRGRAYAVMSADALLPYWFEAQGALFLSDRGDLRARVEGSYDVRLTQRLVLQPRAELEFAARRIPARRIGSGLARGTFGLRLRYELRREFAPYVGLVHERAFGGTADLDRARGEAPASTRVVAGVRAWF